MQTFEKALSALAPVSDAILVNLLKIATRPSEISVEIGFKLSGKGNLILAAAGDEASFKATLKWTKAEANADRAASAESEKRSGSAVNPA